MFRSLFMCALSFVLVACGGGSEGKAEETVLYVNTNQQAASICTHVIANSLEDYEFALNNGYETGKCTTTNTIARCDLSAVSNGSGTEIYYYSQNNLGHDSNSQVCDQLGGTYIQGSLHDGSSEENEDNTISDVPQITVDLAATEYQNYSVEVGRTGLGEVWNIKEGIFERFGAVTGSAGLESYGTFDSKKDGYKVSVFRSADEGFGAALFSFNHSTGAYKQITNMKWNDDSVCIAYKFEVGVFIGGKATSDSTCFVNSTYGFYIDPYMDSEAAPIGIEIVDEIVSGTAKPIMDLAGLLKGYLNNNDRKVYILNGAAEFVSNTVNAELDNAEPISYLTDDKILFKLGSFVYEYSISKLTGGLSGTDITEIFTNDGSISSIYLMSISGENFYRTSATINSSTNEHSYFRIGAAGDITKKVSIETEFGSQLLSTANYYVTASYNEDVDSYDEFSVDPRPTASFKYFDKTTGSENVSKAFSADINGSGCMVQGDNEFAIVHDNHVSFVNDNGTLNTYINSHLFYMYDASQGQYGNGTASFMITNYDTSYTQYLKNSSYLGTVDINSGGSLYGCFYGGGVYVDNAFFANTNQMAQDKFLYGDLTGEVNVY